MIDVNMLGKCRQMSQQLVDADPSLTLVRGHYECPISGKKHAHWWCVDRDGNIVDVTVDQFYSRGSGTYIPFDGFVNCSECGQKMEENEVWKFHKNYVFCSKNCYLKFIGLSK